MPVMAVAAGIGAVGSIASSVIGSNAAKSAADTQARSAQAALDFQRDVYNKNQTNLAPYMDIGKGATYKLSSLTGTGSNSTPDFSQFYLSPDYQFRQQQGELGIERAANARGMNLSGGTLRDLASFNSGLASTEYGNYFDRLMGLSKLGAGAAGSLAGNNATMASTIGNTTMGVGQANAAGTIGSANAITGGISNFGNNALLAAYLSRGSGAGSVSAYGGGSNPFNSTGSLY